MENNIHFSSESNEWSTPQWLYDKLDKTYNFIWDLACTYENKKCKYGLFQKNGSSSLERDWSELPGGGWLWLNPPYGEGLPKWVAKAYEESLRGANIVMLIPARTDTSYWHDYIFGKAEILFIRGRLKFGDAEHNAPFPSAIIVFKSYMNIGAIKGSLQLGLF